MRAVSVSRIESIDDGTVGRHVTASKRDLQAGSLLCFDGDTMATTAWGQCAGCLIPTQIWFNVRPLWQSDNWVTTHLSSH